MLIGKEKDACLWWQKCFIEYEDASSQIKLHGVWRHFVLNEKNASMWTKTREGVFRLRLKKLKVWVLSTAKQFTHGRKGKNILQGMDKNVQCFDQLIITIFCQIMQRYPKFFTDNYKTKLQESSALWNKLRLNNLPCHHPAHKSKYKVIGNEGKQR